MEYSGKVESVHLPKMKSAHASSDLPPVLNVFKDNQETDSFYCEKIPIIFKINVILVK